MTFLSPNLNIPYRPCSGTITHHPPSEATNADTVLKAAMPYTAKYGAPDFVVCDHYGLSALRALVSGIYGCPYSKVIPSCWIPRFITASKR